MNVVVVTHQPLVALLPHPTYVMTRGGRTALVGQDSLKLVVTGGQRKRGKRERQDKMKEWFKRTREIRIAEPGRGNRK